MNGPGELKIRESLRQGKGTTFLEGLTFFNNKWYIYYGTADSRVAVIVWDPDLN